MATDWEGSKANGRVVPRDVCGPSGFGGLAVSALQALGALGSSCASQGERDSGLKPLRPRGLGVKSFLASSGSFWDSGCVEFSPLSLSLVEATGGPSLKLGCVGLCEVPVYLSI